ncbi:hypothetical protein [Tenacibaculum agarivorans]|uniref:hypothetical protein n=1 Tax=Tenacibaculum agarivorans TaxID=1908389 RepID=UPI00094BA1A5|nr:hypothetical protein [Tenacibaculum agarivorans]
MTTITQKFKSYLYYLCGLFLLISCNDNAEDNLDNTSISCTDITTEIFFNFNGEKITSLDFVDSAIAYFPLVKDATSYEWTVNGKPVENKFTADLIKELPEDIIKLIPEKFKNSVQITFDRFTDAEVILKVKTPECTDGITKTKSYIKTPAFNACDAGDFHMDLTKDFKNIILNPKGVLGLIKTEWKITAEDGTSTKSDVVHNYTTTLPKGIVEVSLDISWSGLSDKTKNCTGSNITRKIVFSDEVLAQLKKDFATNPINQVSLRFTKNDDGTYTPKYAFTK